MSKTYCAYPWTSLMIGNDRASPCCNFQDTILLETSVDEFFHGEYMNKIRQDMLLGKKVNGCSTCYIKENSNITSERERINKEYGKVEIPKLTTLDIALDNICNLKCRMCNSGYSHSWKSDELALYGKTIDRPKYIKTSHVENIDVSQLTRIIIQGGEPFYSPDIEKLFDKLNKESTLENISLWITTNATIEPSEKIKKYFSRFKEVAISLSLDGYDTLFEYIRKNADFEKVKSVLDYYHRITNEKIQFNINCTVSMYNVNLIDKIQSYYKTHYPKFKWNENFVNFPAELNIQNAPEDFKSSIEKIIKNKTVIQYMNDDGEDLFKHFIDYTEKLDHIRNENIKNSNPWLWTYMNNYNKRVTKEEANIFNEKMFELFWDKE